MHVKLGSVAVRTAVYLPNSFQRHDHSYASTPSNESPPMTPQTFTGSESIDGGNDNADKIRELEKIERQLAMQYGYPENYDPTNVLRRARDSPGTLRHMNNLYDMEYKTAEVKGVNEILSQSYLGPSSGSSLINLGGGHGLHLFTYPNSFILSQLSNRSMPSPWATNQQENVYHDICLLVNNQKDESIKTYTNALCILDGIAFHIRSVLCLHGENFHL
ncbi:uncharacterized protein EV420DRAFT_1489039 [Desarmillaria tabescens]|uniref:Uncharacterized protein n=1 Tax=Armillaria tabescens TaxID=1929756 RepID=A0AA39MH27_ARMTA|nr:uncharacterized protein EV420DRAFT_1489039 [Desarmillaria tabescens]KAK0433593.1 hypothetical protein EV420DRAFT_1489039 [Desarmillaria tabescens]